jgi:hypothetical protein
MFDCSSLNERRLKAGNMGYLLAARTRRWEWCIIARLPLAALLGALLVVGPLTIPFAHAINQTVNTCPGSVTATINRCDTNASPACPNGDPQDLIIFNNVTAGNFLTIAVTNSGDIDPTNVDLVGSAGTGDPSPASLSPSPGATVTAGYTVQDKDGTDARFKIDVAVPNVNRKFVTYTAFCKISQASWTLSMTPSPATYSAVGASIGYSYVLTNTGETGISITSVTGIKTGTITCAAGSLAIGASTTCSSSYTTVAGDVPNNIAASATANGTPGGGTLASATDNATVTFVASDMSVSLSDLPDTATVGTPYSGSITCTNTGTVAATNATCTASGGPPGFTTDCDPTAASLAAGGTMTCTISGTPGVAGSYTVTGDTGASNDATADNNTAAKEITIGPAAQTITFTSTPPSSALVGGTYMVTATGGLSGNPVTFSTTSPACTVTPEGDVGFVAAGSCAIEADQAGTANFTAAQTVTQGSTSGRAAQAVANASTPPTRHRSPSPITYPRPVHGSAASTRR